MSSSSPPRRKPRGRPQRIFRVNARLDGETHEQLEALEAQTRLSTSDVVREALRRMHAELVARGERARSALDGVVGKYGGAPRDLSERTKAALGVGWAKKHAR
jgi:Arc/MetJ-type ribon-helix-helix transcriptional regulator